MSDSNYDKGMRVRREVLGDAHVDQALARQSAFDADFQKFVAEVPWGTLWSRPDLDRRTRSMVTIGILAALGRSEELALHIKACDNTGVKPQEIAEVLMHVAVYAGVPAANAAFALAKKVLAAKENATANEGNEP